MTSGEYLLLFEKFLAGKATPEEVEKLASYRDQFELLEPQPEEQEHYAEVKERLLKRLDNSINGRVVKIGYKKWLPAVAAMLLLTISIFIFKYDRKKPVSHTYASNNNKPKNDIAPGSDRALLTLSNGKTIELNSAANGTILKQGGVAVKKQKNGLIVFDASLLATNNGKATGTGGAVEYNTISTPRGGQYQVILPDGSKVWLNAASSLRFPAAFTGNERDVQLTGEGYFEVAKNKQMPFRVSFNNEVVEVLGTHFDIMAYKDEDESRTTLLEGSVRISKGGFNKVLIPGQQAVSLTAQGSGYSIKTARVDEVMAWKNGYFLFQDEDIEHIMRQVARWYDVDVIYQGNRRDQVYGGRISRFKNISELLSNLELTGTIHFGIEGRRVTVME